MVDDQGLVTGATGDCRSRRGGSDKRREACFARRSEPPDAGSYNSQIRAHGGLSRGEQLQWLGRFGLREGPRAHAL